MIFARGAGRAAAQGFTLVELMIVVAIVGILSAIAIPQYQIYTGKAQLAEALELVSGRKAAIVEQFAIDASLTGLNGGVRGIPPDITSGVGRYVQSLEVIAGTIVATMRSAQVSPCVIGATLTMAPLMPSAGPVSISWVCTTTAACKPQSCT